MASTTDARIYERYVRPFFSSYGKVDLDIARRAVGAVATELGVPSTSFDQMYQLAR